MKKIYFFVFLVELLISICQSSFVVVRVKCLWNAMRNARHIHTLLYLICFLISLNENLKVIKSQILLIDPFSTMNKIFSMVSHYETKNVTHGKNKRMKIYFHLIREIVQKGVL